VTPRPETTGAGITLSQIEALVAVVDHGSFTAAADVLGISQPSLSRRIHTLETTLGTQLFVAAGRTRELTDAGRNTLSAGRRAHGEVATIRAMSASTRALTTGTLRIASLPSLVAAVSPDLIGRFHRLHPGVRIDVFGLEEPTDIVEALRTGRADVAITTIERIPSDLQAEPLPSQVMVAVVSEDAAGSGMLRREALAGRTLVTLPRGTSIRALTDSVYRELRTTPARVITTTQRDSLVPLAVASGAITIVPEILASSAPRLGGVVIALPTATERAVGLIHVPAAIQNPALAEFLELAR
jgi:DNA-binding transcriptional LysR family regulator